MIDPQTRKAIYLLHVKGMSARKISRTLKVSRKTVQEVIAAKGEVAPSARGDKIEIEEERLRKLYTDCDGYRTRMHEELAEAKKEEEKQEKEEKEQKENDKDKERTPAIGYSTLTRRLRELGIGTGRDERCDRVPDQPGAEMQHDTTQYIRPLGGRHTRLIGSLLYLRYAKVRYLQFYRVFNRFVMKYFFHKALMYWLHTAPVCVVDNTSLARLRGSGKNAVIAPEMEAFSGKYGFRFKCHAIGHANRKAGTERSFYTVETNFFPGRKFETLEDLNRQALEWSTVKMANRPVAKSGLIPAKAFEYEKSFLKEIPAHLPAPYLPLKRLIDQYGYVAADANFYWVPGEGRGSVKVLLYGDHLEIYRGRVLLAEYPLAPDGVTNECFSPKGQPKPRYKPKSLKKRTAEEEKRLRAMGDVVERYLDFSLKEKSGQGRHRFIRELFRLSGQLTPAGFLRALERALKHGVTSMETVRNIARLQLTEGDGVLPFVEIDQSFEEREAYLEGCFSDEPDLSVYDELLEEEEEKDG